MDWNLPNTLTFTRIAAIPLIILLFYMPYPWADPAAGLLFAAAMATLRGASARSRASERSSTRWRTSSSWRWPSCCS
jgi:phosphatidylglycerophosphate synthase